MNKINLISEVDSSLNYIIPKSDGGFLESRFVQRSSDYFIVYLSSHTGCNQACRMCHLTQSKQTMMTSASLEDYLEQARNVLENVDYTALKAKGLKRVKFSFMARGEPLLNETIQTNWDVLRRELRNLVPGYYDVEFNISTIYPKEFTMLLQDIFKTADVTIYYSIYSYVDEFRKKWLGKAENIRKVLPKLKWFASSTPCKVKFHSAFIEGENDSIREVEILKGIIRWDYGNDFNFNIVKYNPYSDRFGKETDPKNLFKIRQILNAKVKSRVGYDVKASCGMFYGANS